jgi:arylsulfatase A-like enzyme
MGSAERLRRALLATLIWVGASACEAPSRPNVVIVVLDTTRADVLSTYGNAIATTPNLDAVAAEGARFQHAYATGFWTLPSHASIFTGHYPSVHGATSETNELPSDADTLAEVLKRAGWRTGAFVSNPWVSRERGFAQGFETFEEVWRPRAGVPHEDRGGIALARAWLSERSERREPFLLFLNLNTAHMPYAPDPQVLQRLHPRPRPLERRAHLQKITGTWRHLAGDEPLDAVDFEMLRELYEAEIAMTDSLLGELIDELRRAGVLDETLVVVTSDHGENLGDHGMIDHMLSLYDATVRVPLILRYPPRVPPGQLVEELASLVDVAPTVLDACGLPLAALPGPGRSLLDPGSGGAKFVIAENDRPVNGIQLLRGAYPGFDTTAIDRRMRMLRTSRHKLIWREGGPAELFDLERDPEELHDLWAREPELRSELQAQLDEWMSQNQTPREGPTFESEDDASLEQLRALGYIE